MISAAEVAVRIKRLPIFPEAPARLAALLAQGSSGVDEFEKVIKPDPGLTANLLRLANSAYFGLTRRIASAREAITILGLKRVYDVASMAAMQGFLPPRLPGYELSSDGYWQHCVAVACLAENMARAGGAHAPALVFTAGLMHDIGKLVLGEFLALHAAPILEKLRHDGVSLIGAEREILGVDHTEVGAEVASLWKLPDAVVSVIRWHHDPSKVPEGVDRSCIDLVHVADALAHSFGFGADVGELRRPLDAQAFDRLKLAVPALELVAAGSLADIESLTGLAKASDPGDKS
jgi:putative nucleotidyltransferase with HDIG domain